MTSKFGSKTSTTERSGEVSPPWPILGEPFPSGVPLTKVTDIALTKGDTMFTPGHRTTMRFVAGLALILNTFTLLAYDLQQERTWGGVDRDGAQGVAAAADGSVYVTGGTRSFGTV